MYHNISRAPKHQLWNVLRRGRLFEVLVVISTEEEKRQSSGSSGTVQALMSKQAWPGPDPPSRCICARFQSAGLTMQKKKLLNAVAITPQNGEWRVSTPGGVFIQPSDPLISRLPKKHMRFYNSQFRIGRDREQALIEVLQALLR